MTMNQVLLNDMQPGEKGTIKEINGRSSHLHQRLLEMGLTKGTHIEIVRFAPMGDPIEIAVRGYRLSLRKIEAESVLVTKEM
jgi:Fe2+ transport system protein FeoA